MEYHVDTIQIDFQLNDKRSRTTCVGRAMHLYGVCSIESHREFDVGPRVCAHAFVRISAYFWQRDVCAESI